MKSSFIALSMAAGLATANAADLGGNCCADLEERVAELEATVAKKGTRKVSLTVYGWVNKMMMHWDDGFQSNNYLGIDNTNSATRFGFRGDAAINSEWKAGYSILLDVVTGAVSSGVSQLREDVPAACAVTTAATSCGVNQFINDHAIRMRDANVFLESSRIGRFTMGRLTVSGPQGTIDLGGIGNVASGSQSLVGGGFGFRNAAGQLILNAAPNNVAFAPNQPTLASASDALADYNNRVDGIKWDSPTWHGFVVGASIGEARDVDRQAAGLALSNATGSGPLGRLYALNLRYAGEFNGVRVASAVGYERSQAEETMASAGGSASPFLRADSTNFGYSGSMMHTATGLFLQGHWIEHKRGNNDGTADKATNTMIQAGIARNWFGIGNTALYGEYSTVKNGLNTFGLGVAQGDFTGTFKSDYRMWGVGISQNIDAAAMVLYAGYRNHSLDTGTLGGSTGTVQFTNAGKMSDFGTFIAGARINF